MSNDYYRFTINGSDVATMYELNDGYWDEDAFDSNQSASFDGAADKVTVTEDHGAYQEIKVYALVSGQDYYVPESTAYVDPDGNPITAQPGPINDRNGDGYDDDDVDHDGFENDTLSGTSGNDRIFGRAGDDSIVATSGNDYLNGGKGDDHLAGGSGRDLLVGSSGKDNLAGGTGNDRLIGGSGADDLFGGDGKDSLFGGRGNDTLYDGAGKDHVIGGYGDDLFIAGAGNDFYQGAAGNDTISYEYALDGVTLSLQRGRASSINASDDEPDPASVGVDRIYNIQNATGSEYGDRLVGNAGYNTLDGGAGADVLIGGLGKDKLIGGLGDDIFRFNRTIESKTGYKSDKIADFSDGDLIDLRGIDAIRGTHSNDAFSFVDAGDLSSANARGAVWFDNGILYGSTDRDTQAEFQVKLVGVSNLDATDLVL